VPNLEIVNVVGMITYEQELDLHALADTFSDRDEIASVTFDPQTIIGWKRDLNQMNHT